MTLPLRRGEEQERNDTHENHNAYGSHRVLMVLDNENRSDESSYAEEEVDELNPIILVITGKENEDTEVA